MPYDTPLSPQNAQAPPTSAGEGIEKTPETLIEIEHARYRKKFREPDSPLAQRLLTNIIIAIKGELKKHPINEYEPTELGQAEAAAEYLQSLIRYSPALGWLVYDFNEGRYRTDYGEMVLYGVLKYLAKERSSIDFSTKVDKATIVYAEKTVTKSGISNVAGLLKTDPSVYCLPTDFDADPYLLNCKGITYNLKTGEREISVPEHMHTKTAAFEPVQGKMDRFFEFLAEITCGDKGLGAWLMRWFGYCLTGDVSAAYFANFYGVGGNGKGVLLRLMQKILGSYAVSLSPKAIVLQGRDTEGRFDLTDLPGARLAIIDDVPEGRLAEGTIKQLTGEGTMRIERKFKDSFQFTPIAKLTLASNKQLTIKDTGNSMRRRMRTIPFDFIPTKDKLDPRLEEKLLQEGPSILFWAIEEAGLYLSNPGPAGLPGCTVIDEASKEYLDSQDTTRLFLEEKTEKSGDESESGVKARELYEAYKTWCEENGYKAKTNHIFGKELKLIGIEKSRTHQGRLYNVKLKN